jgi:hypothetical protein
MQEREFLNLGEMLGMGFDSLQEKLCPNSAIDQGMLAEQLQKMQAQQKSSLQDMFDFKYIENQGMLAEQFNISGSVSGKGSFGPLSIAASMRGEHFSVNQVKEENLYILLKYQLFNTAYRLINPRLSVEANNILNSSSDSGEFRKKFGDEFIIGFKTGAEYTALIQIFGVQKNQHFSTYGEINAAVNKIMFEAELSVSSKTEKLEALKKFSSQVSVFRKPSTSEKSVMNLDNLIEDFMEFKKIIKNGHCPQYTTIFSDYDQLVDINKSILTPKLKQLKSKLNKLRAHRMTQEIELLNCANRQNFDKNMKLLKFEGESQQLLDRVSKLRSNINDINEFIDECLYLPNAINSERYDGFLKFK